MAIVFQPACIVPGLGVLPMRPPGPELERAASLAAAVVPKVWKGTTAVVVALHPSGPVVMDLKGTALDEKTIRELAKPLPEPAKA